MVRSSTSSPELLAVRRLEMDETSSRETEPIKAGESTEGVAHRLPCSRSESPHEVSDSEETPRPSRMAG